ncbi:hypothetical protein [Hymenobacter sediminicola]|uniref:DUF1795 domain-containing protein n=1 Tax=Hymenobacter sediminicola TaxID=2761579 RepID=A0A7G7W4I5_9BACT|nr:hypothetical protein [Hymenobacter sediminicola]QNH61278.1 hypothetical protein H4317_14045 [Hymenobacter sediminicola]
MEKRELLDGRITLLVPAGFKPMNKDMLALKYPGNKPPQEVLTDERGATNVAFNWTPVQATQTDLSAIEGAFYASRLRQDDIVWYSHGVKTINGRQVGYLEMLTPAPDTEVYNLLFFTDLEGRLLLVTFNCVKKDMEAWKANAHLILNSLQVIPKP